MLLRFTRGHVFPINFKRKWKGVGGGETERNVGVRETGRWAASCTRPDLVQPSNLHPRYVPSTRNLTLDPSVCRPTLYPRGHSGQGATCHLKPHGYEVPTSSSHPACTCRACSGSPGRKAGRPSVVSELTPQGEKLKFRPTPICHRLETKQTALAGGAPWLERRSRHEGCRVRVPVKGRSLGAVPSTAPVWVCAGGTDPCVSLTHVSLSLPLPPCLPLSPKKSMERISLGYD